MAYLGDPLADIQRRALLEPREPSIAPLTYWYQFLYPAASGHSEARPTKPRIRVKAGSRRVEAE